MLTRAFAIALCVCCSSYAQSVEDPQLRAQAVGLIERANRLSSPVWPMNEEVFTFQIQNPEPGAPTDGSLKVGVGAPGLKRWEFSYGAYQLSQVRNGEEVATYTTGTEPAAVVLVRKIVPVSLVRFDQTDVIRKIEERTIEGTAATCIDFETIAGTRHQFGTLCVDKSAGYLIYQKIDDVIIKQSKFYRFNNGFFPAHIERWTGVTKLADIEGSVVVKKDFPTHYFDYPPAAVIAHTCNSFTPAYAESTPQPGAKTLSDKGIDIVVHGVVDKDGHPAELQILDDTHHELAAEAMQIVAGWTFHAAQCGYKPTMEHRDFIVHFQGWQ